ncbi:MAG TPA: hypothetical protein VG435_13080 [Acidimicrobiales bacterium]|jgi:hypothetical protein|nr:hypothetical protein [Acidimicrobiales bacterium]
MLRLPFLPPSRRTLRRILGALWLIDAILQAQPAFFGADWWRSDLAGSSMGEPAAIRHSILWAVGIIAAHPALWNSVFVAVQALLGLALLTGRGDRLAIVASLPWALGVWSVGEGFGMLPTGFAMAAFGAPGPVLLYPLIGLLSWPRGDRRGISPVLGGAAWIGLWAAPSVLQLPLVFPVRQVLTANLHEMSDGLPGWEGAVAGWTSSVVLAHPAVSSAALAAVQVAIGLAVCARRGRRAAIVAGVAVSGIYWVCFQGLGGILGGGVVASGATDPGAAPLMVLLALALWPYPDRVVPGLPASGRSGSGRPVPVQLVSGGRLVAL